MLKEYPVSQKILHLLSPIQVGPELQSTFSFSTVIKFTFVFVFI
jgi:hypothetical protein